MALWSCWTWGQKHHMGDFFLSKFLVKKAMMSCNEGQPLRLIFGQLMSSNMHDQIVI